MLGNRKVATSRCAGNASYKVPSRGDDGPKMSPFAGRCYWHFGVLYAIHCDSATGPTISRYRVTEELGMLRHACGLQARRAMSSAWLSP
jgi:hypothetical protein